MLFFGFSLGACIYTSCVLGVAFFWLFSISFAPSSI